MDIPLEPRDEAPMEGDSKAARLAAWLALALFLASFALQLFDLLTRHEISLLATSEWDRYVHGIYAPGPHFDLWRPKGYLYTVHYTTLRLVHDSLFAAKLLNLSVYVATCATAFFALRRVPAVLLALAIAMVSPKMLESAMAGAPDAPSTWLVFLVWTLGYLFVRSSSPRARAALLGVAAALTVWVGSMRMQSSVVLAASSAVFLVAARIGPLREALVGLPRFAFAIGGLSLVDVVVFRTPLNFQNIAVAAFARHFQNRIWPDIGSMFNPAFPQTPGQFLAIENAPRAVLVNWIFNLQAGLVRYLTVWPWDIREYLSVSILSFVLTVTLAIVAVRLYRLASGDPTTRVVLGFAAAHFACYLVWCLAFFLDRFVLYAMPLCTFFLVQYVLLENVRWRRLAVAAVFGLTAWYALRDFREVYLEQIHPFSQTWLDLAPLPEMRTPSTRIRLEQKNGDRAWDYGDAYVFTITGDDPAPERRRLFLPRAMVNDRAQYVVRFRQGDKIVAEIDLATAPLLTTCTCRWRSRRR